VLRDFILARAPVWCQNVAISMYNRWQWWVRHNGSYRSWYDLCEDMSSCRPDDWADYRENQLKEFLSYAVEKSPHYAGCNPEHGLQGFPILEKKTVITDFERIRTIPDSKGIVSYTGGTTGASMKVVYAVSDMQKRFATLDWFRALSGWKIGRRTAWFSGKGIVRDSDISRGICYRDDFLTKTRFFSTFHVNERNFDIYWRSLVEFAPEYIVGFPSSIAEILAIARERGLIYPHRVIAVFPTAETVIPAFRELFRDVLGADTKDQYASSEGAPFIVECSAGRLHILPYTGVVEVVDDQDLPAREGEMLVTSFHTHGTPLIRYRIGDRVALAPEGQLCSCGWTFPLVDRIEGRSADFVWSPEYGRVNLGNLSNSTKGVPGIIAFRVLQNEPHSITVEINGSSLFDISAERKFEIELRKRLGEKISINMVRMNELPRKSSGKFRIVENSLTPDQMIHTAFRE
jgi:phenylacetate-CoA ligase